MEIVVSTAVPSSVQCDLLVMINDEELSLFEPPQGEAAQWLEEYRKAVSSARVKSPDLFPAPDGYQARLLMTTAVMMGSRKRYPRPEQMRAVAQEIYKFCEGTDKNRIAIVLNGPDGAGAVGRLVEGFVLASYFFSDFRAPKKFPERLSIELLVRDQDLESSQQALEDALHLAQCQNLARDLINRPGSVAVPSYLAEQAQAMAQEAGLECEVLDESRLAAEGYNGLMTVGKGGNHPPRMVILRYRPEGAPAEPHLCLLGKGLTFDTGGLCIKSGMAMWEMIGDMSGAAAVLAAMRAISRCRPPITVTGIMVCAQNDVDANSVKPGDCFIARNGKSVHVLNTDAEGRLILTDGLFRAGKEGATHLVDIATLTGACARALGESLSGLFSNDTEFQELVRGAGESEGEILWPLPLFAEYRGLLDHYRTDINNTSKSSDGGAITAALFLQEFLPEGIKWAHLDVAGTAFGKTSWRYLGPGGRGIMVRTFLRLAQKMAQG